jgi:exodeoxyribonuclease VII large subunit
LAPQLQPTPDILVVTRGGGSLEDLWSFNEEPLVRAVCDSPIPTISAVGHEIDVTLCDLAADVRALTPTEAGELSTPSREELGARLLQAGERLTAGLRRRASAARERLAALADRRCFRRPYDRLHEWTRRLDEWEARATAALRRRVQRGDDQLVAAAQRLEALSPLAILTRGYSMTTRDGSPEALTRADEVAPGTLLRTRLSQGQIVSRVERLDP